MFSLLRNVWHAKDRRSRSSILVGESSWVFALEPKINVNLLIGSKGDFSEEEESMSHTRNVDDCNVYQLT